MEKPQLHIEKPCLEDWNKMSPNQTGRHCQLCDKTVVDFTQMSPEEISNYLTKKSKERICGRIWSSTHLHEEKISKNQRWFNRLYHRIEDGVRFKPVRMSLLGTLSLLMLLTGCTENHKSDGVKKQQVRRITHTDTLVGDTITPGIQKEISPIRETTLGNIARPDFDKSPNKTIQHTTPPEAVPIVGKIVEGIVKNNNNH